MFKSALPVILIIAAIGLFYSYIDPTYTSIQSLLAREQKFDDAITKSRELQLLRDTLRGKRNAMSADDLTRLNKLLPDHIDNVRLALDIDGIASVYNMRIKNISIRQSSLNERQKTIGPETSAYESTVLTFSVASTYDNLLLFLKDIERSLRIVDTMQLSFAEPNGDLYEYKISIRTYWLK